MPFEVTVQGPFTTRFVRLALNEESENMTPAAALQAAQKWCEKHEGLSVRLEGKALVYSAGGTDLLSRQLASSAGYRAARDFPRARLRAGDHRMLAGAPDHDPDEQCAITAAELAKLV